jgi:DNA-binding transcriptional ArsR family regulator
MVVDDPRRADAIFHELADATRRDIAIVAMGQEHSVSSLARRYPMSVTAVQKHVTVLERAGLVTKERHGREQLVRGNIDAVREAFTVLERLEAVWRARLDRFGDVLAGITESATRPATRITTQEPGDPT